MQHLPLRAAHFHTTLSRHPLTPVFSSSAMAVTALLPRMVPRMVWGRRNFQNASLNATIFWAAVRSSGFCRIQQRGQADMLVLIHTRLMALQPMRTWGGFVHELCLCQQGDENTTMHAPPDVCITHQRARSCRR